jgi:hypothetical protein
MVRSLSLLVIVLATAWVASAQSYKVLFDNTLNETAGNADWIVDTQQPVPVPAQSGITSSTAESYWLGASSAWGVELAKRGFTVHTLTSSYGITYGNAGNAYDLSNYDLFIVCEPQNQMTAAEKLAIRTFVQNGGGLLMVADHNASDRDSDGWDSPEVWNDAGIDTYFGLHFQSTGESDNSISETSFNVAPSATDSIIHGAAGTVTSLAYHAGTTIRLLTANNATAAGHVWMTGAPQSTSKIMAATARYGSGRVGAVGDSSPADDGTGQSGNDLYTGWTEATDDILFLNMSLWLVAGGSAAPPAQAALASPAQGATGLTGTIRCSWFTTPSADRYEIQVATTSAFTSTVVDDSTRTDTSKTLPALVPGTTYYWRVRARNTAGWGTYSEIRNFQLLAVPAQAILQNPGDGETGTPVPAICSWQSVAGAGRYHFEIDTSASFTTPLVLDSSLTSVLKLVGSLAPNSWHYWRVRAGNAAGWGTFSAARSFRTWTTPDQTALVAPDDGARGLPSPVGCRWIAVSGALKYHFQLAADSAISVPVVSDSALTDTVRSLAGIDTMATYYWRVRAGNAAGWGAFTPVRSFRVAAGLNVTASVRTGWSMVSVPVVPPDLRASTLFPSASSPLYAYQAGYAVRETLSTGTAYWARFDAPGTVTFTGEPLPVDTIDVVRGWNLIGSVSTPAAASSLTSIPPGLIVFPLYGFDGGYSPAEVLVPGGGYWIRCTAPGRVILGGPTASSAAGRPRVQ